MSLREGWQIDTDAYDERVERLMDLISEAAERTPEYINGVIFSPYVLHTLYDTLKSLNYDVQMGKQLSLWQEEGVKRSNEMTGQILTAFLDGSLTVQKRDGAEPVTMTLPGATGGEGV